MTYEKMTRIAPQLAVLAGTTAFAACLMMCNGSVVTTCTQGQSISCTGSNGCAGNQTCNSQGAYDPCVCGEMDSGVDAAATPDTGSDVAVADVAIDVAPDAFTCNSSTAPLANNKYGSNPAAAQTNETNGFYLHKELNAYNGYGATDGKADIVYTGEVGAWTFSVPATTVKSAYVVLSVVLDDGTDPTSAYSFRVWSDSCYYDNTTALPHGAPFNSQFTNWVKVTEPANPTSGSTFTVTISNTSQLVNTGWIAIDWIELHIVTN